MATQDLSVPVIAIDGGAGVGKGTARMLVAARLGFHCLDSGVLYRVLGLVCEKEDALSSEAEAAYFARHLSIAFAGERVLLEGRDITEDVRSERAGKLASGVAAMPLVRQGLLELQLSFREAPGLVADGRDMGKIFDTPHRFFLSASLIERARRRFMQLKERGMACSYEDIFANMVERDERDENREANPLEPHPEAHKIETTFLTPKAVCDRIVHHYLHSEKLHA